MIPAILAAGNARYPRAKTRLTYALFIERRAQRSLSRIAAQDRDRISGAIRRLADEPRPRGVKKLRKGSPITWTSLSICGRAEKLTKHAGAKLMTDEHRAQVINYLKATGKRRKIGTDHVFSRCQCEPRHGSD